MEPHWLSPEAFRAALDDAYPGLHLIRADGLAAALDAPCTAFYYGGQTDILLLAALYAERIAKAHAFADGNKRAATIGCLLFLAINGVSVAMPQDELADCIEMLAAGTRSAGMFAEIMGRHCRYDAPSNT